MHRAVKVGRFWIESECITMYIMGSLHYTLNIWFVGQNVKQRSESVPRQAIWKDHVTLQYAFEIH
jgi:hypothetical protein